MEGMLIGGYNRCKQRLYLCACRNPLAVKRLAAIDKASEYCLLGNDILKVFL